MARCAPVLGVERGARAELARFVLRVIGFG